MIIALLACLSLPAIFWWCVSTSHHVGNKQQSISKKQLQSTLWFKLRCRFLIFLPRLNFSSSRWNRSNLFLTLCSTWLWIFPHPLQLIWEKTRHKDKMHLLHSFRKHAILEAHEWMFASWNVPISWILAWLVLVTYSSCWLKQEPSGLHVLRSCITLGRSHPVFSCAPFGKRHFQHPPSPAHTSHSHVPSCLSFSFVPLQLLPHSSAALVVLHVWGHFCRLAWHHSNSWNVIIPA